MRLATIALLAAALLPGCTGRHFDERTPAPPGGRLEVDFDRGMGLRPDPGSLVVQAHDLPEVRVVAEASEWGASGVRFQLEHSGREVRVLGRVGGALSWLFGGPRVEVRIWVPREFAVDVRCSAGDVRIEDTTGEVRARSEGAVEVARAEGPVRVRTSGDVRLSEVTGDVDVRLDAGDIDASWMRGRAELRTGGGEIEVSHAEGPLVARSDRGGLELRDVAGPVEAITERGSVYASFTGPPAGRLETSRGSVQVEIPDGAGADLEAESARGRVALEPGLEVPGEHAESRIAGALDGGGERLRLFTARGDVTLRRR